MKLSGMVLPMIVSAVSALAQTTPSSDYRLALPDHKGQLRWSIEGFKIIENSAKADGLNWAFVDVAPQGSSCFLPFCSLLQKRHP